MHRLETLRAYLHHFDNSPDFGDRETVAAIRKHLMMRIREAESAMRYSERMLSPGQAKSAVRSRDRFQLRAEAA